MGMRAIRKQHGLSLAQLSKKLSEEGIKVSPDTLAKYERGQRSMSLERARQIAQFFDVSLIELYGDQYVADNLRLLREQQGLSLTKLSEKLASYGIKVSVATLSQYENHEIKVPRQRLAQFANVYGIEQEQLLIKHTNKGKLIPSAEDEKQRYSQERAHAKAFIRQATISDLRKLQTMICERLRKC
ncbi:helix-turn-helix domain-containing protein [Ligilactobacillus sp. LYQ139]|uniref:helix-turn-helix domain-containing protein n=1 Tax=Ligilactobacillus sp. LYQ139 TaxID=3378800 RepID=UPI003852C54B